MPTACQPDAEAARAQTCLRLPPWFAVQSRVVAHRTVLTRGRPRQDATTPTKPVWQIPVTLPRNLAALEREARRRAAYIIGAHLLDEEVWPDAAVITLYREPRRDALPHARLRLSDD